MQETVAAGAGAKTAHPRQTVTTSTKQPQQVNINKSTSTSQPQQVNLNKSTSTKQPQQNNLNKSTSTKPWGVALR
jgi:hypothetical protein